MSKLIAAAAVVFADHPDAKAVYVCEDGNVFLEERKNLAESHCMTSRLPKPVLLLREAVEARTDHERRADEEAEAARVKEAEEAAAAEALAKEEADAKAAEGAAAAEAKATEEADAKAAEQATTSEQKGSGKGKKGGK